MAKVEFIELNGYFYTRERINGDNTIYADNVIFELNNPTDWAIQVWNNACSWKQALKVIFLLNIRLDDKWKWAYANELKKARRQIENELRLLVAK